MKQKTISADTIRCYDKNPRKMKPDALQRLCESIERDPQFMELRPIVVDEQGTILGGNQRYRACVHLGMKELPAAWVRQASGLTEEQKKRFILLDNSPQGLAGEWDAELLLEEFQIPEFADWGLERFAKDHQEEQESEQEEYRGESEELDDTLLQLKDDIRFDGAGLYEIPKLREDMLLDGEVHPKLFLPNDDNSHPLLLWNFGSDSTKTLDWSRAIVGFYVEDERFEVMWEDTAGRISPFVNRKIAGMLCPNFSCYDTYPTAMRLWNVFRSRWVGRYAQEAGIRIMPDICGQPEDCSWLFDGIPQGACVAFQCHREKLEGAERKNIVLRKAIEVIKPPVIWCYGQQSKAKWYPALEHADCRWITPRTERKRQLKEY